MRVGIVCEGVHDFPALEVLIEEIAASNGIGSVSCHPLQPAPDASSKSGDGGWAKVVAWCQANAGNGLDTYLKAPLFEGEDVFDIILIHLDGDIAHACAQKFGKPLKEALTVKERVQFLSTVLLEAVSATDGFQAKIKTAIPTQKTESWMLAALSLGVHDWEAVEAKQLLLKETGFKDGKPGKSAHYKALAQRLRGTIGQIKSRCKSFEIFSDQFA